MADFITAVLLSCKVKRRGKMDHESLKLTIRHLYNPDGKAIVARENECSALRHEDMSKAYFGCHTDITIPYEQLDEIAVVTKDGANIQIIKDCRFVLPGTEELNVPFDTEK